MCVYIYGNNFLNTTVINSACKGYNIDSISRLLSSLLTNLT